MAQTNVNIRMDSDLIKQFSAFCEDMGMSMTTAFNLFAKKTVREYRIPFEIGAEKPNAETIAAFREADEIIKNPDSVKGYTNIDDMIQDLLA